MGRKVGGWAWVTERVKNAVWLKARRTVRRMWWMVHENVVDGALRRASRVCR